VCGASVTDVTDAPEGVLYVAPSASLTVAVAGLTSTRPLLNERW